MWFLLFCLVCSCLCAVSGLLGLSGLGGVRSVAGVRGRCCGRSVAGVGVFGWCGVGGGGVFAVAGLVGCWVGGGRFVGCRSCRFAVVVGRVSVFGWGGSLVLCGGSCSSVGRCVRSGGSGCCLGVVIKPFGVRRLPSLEIYSRSLMAIPESV